MTRNIINKNYKGKNGYGGGLWIAHRMEGVVKNRGIKPIKKEKKERS